VIIIVFIFISWPFVWRSVVCFAIVCHCDFFLDQQSKAESCTANFRADPVSGVNLCQKGVKAVDQSHAHPSLNSQPTASLDREGGEQTMASRPGPSPLTDQQIQSAVSRLVNFYVRNRKTISRAGWLILLVSLGNRVRVAVNDQRKPRPAPPTTTTTTTKKRKAEVSPPSISEILMLD
jgi:hypothetical protein